MDFFFPDLASSNDAAATPQRAKRLPLTAFSSVTHIPSKLEPYNVLESQKDEGNGRGRLPEGSSSHLDWMKHESAEPPPSLYNTSRWVTSEELRSHRSPTDAWISIKGQVYDVTSYLQFHPGGAKILLASCGHDATAVFDKHHRWIDASYLLGAKKVGRLQASEE